YFSRLEICVGCVNAPAAHCMRAALIVCARLYRGLLRSMDGGGGAREAAAAALETEQRLRDLGYGQGPIAAVENDQIGGGGGPPPGGWGGRSSRRQRPGHVEKTRVVRRAAGPRDGGLGGGPA